MERKNSPLLGPIIVSVVIVLCTLFSLMYTNFVKSEICRIVSSDAEALRKDINEVKAIPAMMLDKISDKLEAITAKRSAPQQGEVTAKSVLKKYGTEFFKVGYGEISGEEGRTDYYLAFSIKIDLKPSKDKTFNIAIGLDYYPRPMYDAYSEGSCTLVTDTSAKCHFSEGTLSGSVLRIAFGEGGVLLTDFAEPNVAKYDIEAYIGGYELQYIRRR